MEQFFEGKISKTKLKLLPIKNYFQMYTRHQLKKKERKKRKIGTGNLTTNTTHVIVRCVI